MLDNQYKFLILTILTKYYLCITILCVPLQYQNKQTMKTITNKSILAEQKWMTLKPMERVKIIYLVGANKINGIKGHRKCMQYVIDNLL